MNPTFELKIVPPEKKVDPFDLTKAHSFPEMLKKLKQLHLRGELPMPAVVKCEPGIYPVKSPWIIEPSESIPVVFQAEKPGETILDGGVTLDSWTAAKINGKKVLRTGVPADCVQNGILPQLFINGKRKTPASYPKNPADALVPSREFRSQKGLPSESYSFENNVIKFNKGDFSADWYDPRGIRIDVIQMWNHGILPVDHIDRDGSVTTTKYSGYPFDPAYTRCIWRNVREKLSVPGEFYFDRVESAVYYLPEKGENEKNITGVVPCASLLMMLNGDPANNRYIRGISFDGIAFRYGGYGLPAVGGTYDFCRPNCPKLNSALTGVGYPGFSNQGGTCQSVCYLPAVVVFRGTKDCSFRNCRVEHCGWYGFFAAEGTSGLHIERNEFADLGAGGIVLTGADNCMENTSLGVSRVLVCDNHIHDCGNVHMSGCGILAGHARGLLIEHNHIHDLYYSGISCGWCWGYGDQFSRENRIGFNLIHDLGKKVLCDMGGIYMLGIQPGTRIYNNVCYDIAYRIYGAWGIYTDEGSSHMVIEKNICYDCSSEGFHQHYGRENICRYNVSAFGGNHGIKLTIGTQRQQRYCWPGKNFTTNYNFMNNVVVVDGVPFFNTCIDGSFDGMEFYSELNVFHNLSDKKSPFFTVDVVPNSGKEVPHTKKEWFEKMGHDTASVFADPGFKDIRKRDFHLKKDSILRKTGKFFDTAETLDHAGIRAEK